MDINTAKKAIYVADLADDTVIMEGPHGIGKSTIVKQLAKENSLHIEELFLSHQEVGDLIGIPDKIEVDGETVTVWSKPSWLKRMEKMAQNGIRSVLFLDELNRAPTDVRQSALQLVLEGQIHDHILPKVDGKKALIVAAINPADDYQVDELDPALLDRFLHILVEPDAKAWLNHARETNTNRIVMDFIAQFPDRLFWQPNDGGIGATPRSWSKLSNYMNIINDIPDDILFQVIKGKIGTEIASQFYSFYKDYNDIITSEEIINVVNDLSQDMDNVEEIAEELKELTKNMEAIHKTELANQLLGTFKKEPLALLAYLYSMPMEVVVAFLKQTKSSNIKTYIKIAEFDQEINNKNLFKKIVKAAE